MEEGSFNLDLGMHLELRHLKMGQVSNGFLLFVSIISYLVSA